ncbi:MAG: hypothetical protein IT438_12025 [Phycisphaerales bacterium]|nr:hypothetical protein [Phycisphaerales bacterium]
MRTRLKLAFLTAACTAAGIAWAVVGAYVPIRMRYASTAIVSGRPGWSTTPGSVHVSVARGAGWLGVGRIRTELALDPGPYSIDQRRGMRPLSPGEWTGGPTGQTVEAPGWLRSIALEQAGPDFNGWQARVAAFGWPRPILYWVWDWRTESLQGGSLASQVNSARGPGRQVPDNALPWRFIWSGLVVNTAVYTGALLLARALLRALVRLRRLARGGCPGCGYELSATTVGAPCPECGRIHTGARAGLAPVRIAWRISKRIVFFAGLGVASTTLVAWGLAAWSVQGRGITSKDAIRPADPTRGELLGSVSAKRSESASGAIVILRTQAACRQETPLPSLSSPEQIADRWAGAAAFPWSHGLAAWPAFGTTDRRIIRGVGWPLVALHHDYREQPRTATSARTPSGSTSQSSTVPRYSTPGGVRLGVGLDGAASEFPTALPLRPAWRGLLVNSAIYGALWGAVWMGLAALRHQSRRSTNDHPRQPASQARRTPDGERHA